MPEIIGYSRDFAPAAFYIGAATEMTIAESLVTVDNWLHVLLLLGMVLQTLQMMISFSLGI
jgi:hypothetical protein